MIFNIIQIILSVLLIACVLLQTQGGGISPVFGGGGEMYRSKRNIEKFLFFATAILAFLLVAVSVLLLLPH
ncbi:MAG: preprotein translocase subunit SecG [Patescibacteria group bacterium]